MRTIQILAAMLLVVGVSAMADEPTIVTTAFHTGYIVDGFDSNDKVQIVAEGLFPNTCYKAAGYTKKIDMLNKVIEVTPQAYKYKGVCLQMVVPYNFVIDLGLLDAGNYTVKDEKHGELGELKVKLATSSAPDDFLYAPVSQAIIEGYGRDRFVTITGEYSNSCVDFKELRVELQKNAIVVLPITEMADRADCVSGKFPFNQTARIDGNIAPGRYLLHVRSLNGNAVSNLVDVY